MEILNLVVDGHKSPMVPREDILKKVRLRKMWDLSKNEWVPICEKEALNYNFIDVVAIGGITFTKRKPVPIIMHYTVFYCYNDPLCKHKGGQLMCGDYYE